MTLATGTRLGPYEILGQLRLDPVFSSGTPRPLFDTASLAVPSAPFDVSSNGKRFSLVPEKEGDHPERCILVIENAF